MLVGWLRDQFRPFLKFGIVGIFALFVDVAVFNLILIASPGSWHTSAEPITAKVISVTLSTVVAWMGNRWWTFRETRRKRFMLELMEYGLVAIGGMIISVGCLWFSHYVLGLESLLADNISTNVIGLILATAFRYLLNRYWVFHEERSHHVVSL
jgi:putative flippase GtrA